MARIAGLIQQTATAQHELTVKEMVEAICPGPAWSVAFVRQGPACFAACDWQPPATFASDGIGVVIDGGIYNRYEFGTSQNDAELFARLYLKYGCGSALLRINGDFAVAVFDQRANELWLARDRFGLKPLYYTDHSGGIAFASRPRGLLTLAGVGRELNHQFVGLFAASHYRYFDNDPARSPYAEIAQLPAANVLHWRGGRTTTKAYWSLSNSSDLTGSETELVDQYQGLLTDAVSLRMKSASRPAFTLSGGMDSSSVLACAVHTTAQKQHAFSTVYEDRTFDESDEIRSMLDTTVTSWHSIPVDNPDVFDLVQRMIEVHDEPVATATWLSHFLLCEEAARRGFRALFGGLGGDELNAGEYEHFFYHFADLRLAGDEQRLAREVKMWVHYHDHPIFQKGFAVVEDAFTRLVDFAEPGRCLPDRRRLTRYAAALNRDYLNLDGYSPVMEHPFGSYLKNRTYQDVTRETIPCCVRAEERQTVTFGLDNYLPFFDHRLVEFMFRVPGTMKYRDGVTKHLLRQAMSGILPEETRTRVKKTGWNAPAHRWFSGRGRQQLLDLINSRSFRERGIYCVREVLRLVDDHEKIVVEQLPQDNHMMFFWQLVNLELWFQWVEHLP
jgi:asparagine synthase (glutamine-hydrolysing)